MLIYQQASFSHELIQAAVHVGSSCDSPAPCYTFQWLNYSTQSAKQLFTIKDLTVVSITTATILIITISKSDIQILSFSCLLFFEVKVFCVQAVVSLDVCKGTNLLAVGVKDCKVVVYNTDTAQVAIPMCI